MVGIALRIGSIFQQLSPCILTARLPSGIRSDLRHFKHTLCQGSGLIKHNILRLRQCLQVIRAFDQNTAGGSAADAAEEAQRNGDYQRAGAADNEEGQCSDDPCAPVCGIPHEQIDQTGQYRQCKRTVADRRGIILCELRDKVLRLCLLHAGVFHKIQYLGNRGFPELLCRLDLQQTCDVDTAADDLLARLYRSGNALTGKCRGIQCRTALPDNAVDGNLFARLNDDDRSDPDLVRVNLFQIPVSPLNVCIIRADIHECADVLTALADSDCLKQFADLIEQHNRNTLGKLCIRSVQLVVDGKQHCSDGCNRHQEILVKDLSVDNAEHCLSQDVIADDCIRYQVQGEFQISRYRQEMQHHQQHSRNDNSIQYLFLFLRHGFIFLLFLLNQDRSRNHPQPSCMPLQLLP